MRQDDSQEDSHPKNDAKISALETKGKLKQENSIRENMLNDMKSVYNEYEHQRCTLSVKDANTPDIKNEIEYGNGKTLKLTDLSDTLKKTQVCKSNVGEDIPSDILIADHVTNVEKINPALQIGSSVQPNTSSFYKEHVGKRKRGTSISTNSKKPKTTVASMSSSDDKTDKDEDDDLNEFCEKKSIRTRSKTASKGKMATTRTTTKSHGKNAKSAKQKKTNSESCKDIISVEEHGAVSLKGIK